VRFGVSATPARVSGAAHAEQGARRTEPAALQPAGEPAMTVERVDDEGPAVRRAERRAHERSGGVIVVRDHRTDLIEEASGASKTVLRAGVSVDHLRVLPGALERPLEEDTPVRAEDPIVTCDHGRQIRACETANMARREVGWNIGRGPRRPAPSQVEGLGHMTRQPGLVFEGVSLIERTSQRRGVEPERDPRRHAAHGRFQQPRAKAPAAAGRIDEHHRNPAEGSVIDADRRADDLIIGDRGKTARGRELQEHAPVGEALIPANRGAQSERAIEIAGGQQPDIRVGRFHQAKRITNKAGTRIVVSMSDYSARMKLSRLGPLTLLLALTASHAAAQTAPNVVLIYADDLGYGDVSAYGAGRIKTPNIDRLAREGLRFTDAHAPAATCTPSRYTLLTGEYAWRQPGTGILPGDAALIIEPGRPTLASVFQRAGYATGVVGKWHLGLGPAGGPDWNGDVLPGPMDVGFDQAFVMAATGDRVPTVFIDNRKVAGLDPADPIKVSYGQPIGNWPTGSANADLLKLRPSHGHDQTIVNGISRIGYMTGGKAALWKDEDMADVFTRKATAFIEEHRAKPFFLYFATHDPHVPRVPHPRFVGKTGMGPRGDAIAQLDWCVGEVLATLDRLKLTRNTLVLFTSDNGPVIDDGYQDQAVEKLGGHTPAGPFRGGKYSSFEGGTRVPFIVRWPGRVKPGISGALVSQVDFLATFAALVGQAAPDLSIVARAESLRAKVDSENVLPALLGKSKTARTVLVEQGGGVALALRQGDWKYIPPRPGARVQVNTNTETGNDPQPQLYDLARDPGERNNLAAARPEKVRELADLLAAIRQRTR
jgi:arylsulfatase A-like enzyme